MGKKGNKKQALAVVQENNESSEDEGPTPLKNRRLLRPVSSESEGEELISSKSHNMRKRKPEEPNIEDSAKKRKMTRCVDSSDEENVENCSVSTPKVDRINKLQEMRKKIQAKKKVSYISSNEESSDEDQKWLVEDEDALPAWENEEAPPEVKDEASDKDDLSDFIVDDESKEAHKPGEEHKPKRKNKSKDYDDVEDLDALSEAEEKLKKSRRKKKNGNTKPTNRKGKEKKNKVDDQESGSSDEEEPESEDQSEEEKPKRRKRNIKASQSDEEDETDSSEEETDYVNPYMQMDREMEDANILDVLSKNTDKDKKNAKKYKKEMGKYQYAVHSDKNRAAKVSKQARFAKNMENVKFDKGFKADRNLDVKDSEYYDYVETCLYGESVRVFPHTKRVSKYKSRCALRGCGEPFNIGETKIVGITKLCDINFRYMKKLNNFGKESFYYVCGHHLPKTGSDSEEYSSGED